jgi:hypothetical protein
MLGTGIIGNAESVGSARLLAKLKIYFLNSVKLSPNNLNRVQVKQGKVMFFARRASVCNPIKSVTSEHLRDYLRRSIAREVIVASHRVRKSAIDVLPDLSVNILGPVTDCGFACAHVAFYSLANRSDVVSPAMGNQQLTNWFEESQ